MGTQVKEEYVAAGLRQQIESLSHVLQEMEKEKMGEEAIAWRLKAVELGLRRLRTVSSEDFIGRYVPTMTGNKGAGREAA
jgi:hypothetical protein